MITQRKPAYTLREKLEYMARQGFILTFTMNDCGECEVEAESRNDKRIYYGKSRTADRAIHHVFHQVKYPLR